MSHDIHSILSSLPDCSIVPIEPVCVTDVIFSHSDSGCFVTFYLTPESLVVVSVHDGDDVFWYAYVPTTLQVIYE